MKLYARHKGANAVAVVTLAITLAACSGGGQSAAPDDPGSAATGQPSAAPDDPGSAATGQPTSTPNWAMTRPAALPADEDKVEITGTVADVNTNQRTFTVLGYRVQIDDDTTYEAVGRELDARRFFAAIRAGLSAQVKGRPDGQSIYAAEIELKYPEVIGKVASVGEGVITLGERTFRYDDDTRLEDGALPTAGDIAEVNYDPTSESDGHAYAAEIGGEDEPQIKSRTTDIDPESGQLKTWLGQTVLTGADTRYKVVGTEVSRSQFFDTVRRGDVIEAEGPLSGGTLQARSIEASYATVKGYSSDVNPDQGTFAVGDEVFYVEGVTHYDDGAQFADISEGTRVEIKWSSARPDDQQRRLAVDVQLKD